jgi:hypothetical protein
VPWAYVRRFVARQWHVPPWVVDAAPAWEVALELRLSNLEAEYARPPNADGGAGDDVVEYYDGS